MQTLPPFTTGQLKAIESIEDCGNGSAIECLGMVFGVVVGIYWDVVHTDGVMQPNASQND